MKYSKFIWLIRQEFIRSQALGGRHIFLCHLADGVMDKHTGCFKHHRRFIDEIEKPLGDRDCVMEDIVVDTKRPFYTLIAGEDERYTDYFRKFFLDVLYQRVLIEEKENG